MQGTSPVPRIRELTIQKALHRISVLTRQVKPEDAVQILREKANVTDQEKPYPHVCSETFL